MPPISMLLRLAGMFLGAAAIALSLVDPDVVSRRSGNGEPGARAAADVPLGVAAARPDPDRAATLGR